MNNCLKFIECFSSGLKDFLHESALQLQKVFDGACGFLLSNQCMTDEVEKVICEISSMKELAIELRSTTSCNYSITKGTLYHNL